MSVVYEVARWAEVFETAESRKYKTLTWISERVDFDSTGWQSGLEEFGPLEWPKVYGNWMILLRVASKAKVRGRLSGDKGEAWTASRIARPSGCNETGIQQAFDFAVKIGWLMPAEISPGDCRENLPERREKNTATEPNETEHYITKPDRTGPVTREKTTGPGRAGDLEIQKNKTSTPCDPTKPESSIVNTAQPESEKLHERAKRMPLLQALAERPVKGSGIEWHGSVFGPDKISHEHVLSSPAEFWISWYCNQLTATNPVLRCGNQAELCYVVAAVYAVRKCTESSLKGHKRIARLINWIKNRECSNITADDFKKSAAIIRRHFGDGPPNSGERQGVSPPSSPQDEQAHYKPTKEKSDAALQRIRENGKKVAGGK